jgi:putative hydrolase of the HAD superfamily
VPVVIVFDGMGVLYRYGDDVTAVLVPYLRELGCTYDAATIRAAYHRCSLGLIDTRELWKELGVAGQASDEEYCARRELTDGVLDLLTRLRQEGRELASLTNDTAAWSVLLRRRFGLEAFISRWFVSAGLGVRKPDPAAYQAVIDAYGGAPEEITMIDDRPVNLEAAASLGLRTILFHSEDTVAHPVDGATFREARTMAELGVVLG